MWNKSETSFLRSVVTYMNARTNITYFKNTYSWNQFTVKSFSKTVISMNFCAISILCSIPHCGKTILLLTRKIIFRQINSSRVHTVQFFTKKSISRNFCAKNKCNIIPTLHCESYGILLPCHKFSNFNLLLYCKLIWRKKIVLQHSVIILQFSPISIFSVKSYSYDF